MSTSKFPLEKKIGYINLWRKRCDDLRAYGQQVSPNDCKQCDEITKEIENELKEVMELREEIRRLRRMYNKTMTALQDLRKKIPIPNKLDLESANIPEPEDDYDPSKVFPR